MFHVGHVHLGAITTYFGGDALVSSSNVSVSDLYDGGVGIRRRRVSGWISSWWRISKSFISKRFISRSKPAGKS